MRELTGPREKIWKASQMVPVEASEEANGMYRLLRDISYPKGFVRLLGLTGRRNYDELTENLPKLVSRFHDDGVFANWTVVQAATFSENAAAEMEALGGAFFRSNMIFLHLPEKRERREEIEGIIRSAEQNRLGVLLYVGPAEAPAGGGAVHVVMEEPEGGWKIGLDLGHSDLALLVAYKLKQNWDCDLVLTAALKEEGLRKEAQDYLKSVAELARIPNAECRTAPMEQAGLEGRKPAITVFSMRAGMDLNGAEAKAKKTGAPCLFSLDSGSENAFA